MWDHRRAISLRQEAYSEQATTRGILLVRAAFFGTGSRVLNKPPVITVEQVAEGPRRRRDIRVITVGWAPSCTVADLCSASDAPVLPKERFARLSHGSL